MARVSIPPGASEIVNIRESRNCCCCGQLFPKRKQMWRYPDGRYLCIACKTRTDGETGAAVKEGR